MKNNKFSALAQQFAGAMMSPIILLVIVGVYVSIGAAFTNYILPEGSFLGGIFSMFASIGFLFMRLLPLWFAVGISFTLSKKEKGWAALSGLVLFLTYMAGIGNYAQIFNITSETTSVSYLMETLKYDQTEAINYNALWTTFAGFFTFNMGIFSGIVSGLITSLVHNKFHTKQMPALFSFFGGTKYVIILVTIISVPLAISTFYVWPIISLGIRGLAGVITSSGLFGTFLFGAVDKALLPLGLHHLIAFPIEYSAIGGRMLINGEWFEGVRNIIVGQAGWAEATGYITHNFTTGRILFQIGGMSGIALAIYKTASPENKKKVAGIVTAAAFTAAFVGISEPIEYTFIFIAPALYFGLYVPMSGLAYVLAEITNVSINGHALFL